MIGVADRVAEKYLRLVRIKSDFVSAACPFHKSGQERHPSFWINRQTGKWGCFSCSAGGSGLKYLLQELNVSNRTLEEEIDIATKEASDGLELENRKRKRKQRASFKAVHTLPDGLLGIYDRAPKALLEAGFGKELLRAHDIGFDRKLRRITFPIRDVFGTLVGISGRNPDGVYPKYKVYEGTREVEGKQVPGELSEHHPTYSSRGVRDHLWRAHFIYDDIFHERTQTLIVVEGFKAALWMVQLGWVNTVALMGSRMSPTQARIIRRMGTETWVFLDNNKPGRDGSKTVCGALANSTFPVYECEYPTYCEEEAQPDDLSEVEIEHVLETANRIGGKVYEAKKYQGRPT